MYFHVQGYTFPRVSPHVEIHVKCVNPHLGFKHAFPHVEIHLSERFTAFGKKKGKESTCGDTHFLVYFPMRIYTFSRVFPHVEIHIVLCNSSYRDLTHCYLHTG